MQQLGLNDEAHKGLDGEVLMFDSLTEVNASSQAVRLDYNAILHCRQGRIQIELADHRQVNVRQEQMLLLPANKLVQPMMVSTDVDASVLLVSDRVLKSALGKQVSIWNKAMYMDEIFVLSGGPWMEGIENFSKTIFKSGRLMLRDEVVMAFIRMLGLMVCEELAKQTEQSDTDAAPTGNEKAIFNSFLTLLAQEPNKRQRVSYYADRLNISSKYLSTVCRRVSDKSPLRWITESVMEDCYALLTNTDLSVKEISNRLGFPNSSFFGQFFREQAGMTPVEYRNRREK